MMSPYSGSKCGEEDKEPDMYYLEIEERIMLVISEGEEDDEAKKIGERYQLSSIGKTEVQVSSTSSFMDGGWCKNPCFSQLQTVGTGNGKKNINAMIRFGSSIAGCSREPNFLITERRGTGVFFPKSAAYY